MTDIKYITTPNTCSPDMCDWYKSDCGYTFEIIQKNGEMALINWIRISSGGVVIAEIKESVCNIYFQ